MVVLDLCPITPQNRLADSTQPRKSTSNHIQHHDHALPPKGESRGVISDALGMLLKPGSVQGRKEEQIWRVSNFDVQKVTERHNLRWLVCLGWVLWYHVSIYRTMPPHNTSSHNCWWLIVCLLGVRWGLCSTLMSRLFSDFSSQLFSESRGRFFPCVRFIFPSSLSIFPIGSVITVPSSARQQPCGNK